MRGDFLESLLFIYNIVMIVVFAMSISGYMLLYNKKQEETYLLLPILYLLLVFDHSLVFILEFMPSLQTHYALHEIFYILIYLNYIAVYVVLRSIPCHCFGDLMTKRELWITVLLISILAGLFIFANFRLSEFLIYMFFFLGLASIALRSFKHVRAQCLLKANQLKSYRILLALVIVVCLLGILDNAIYYGDYYTNTIMPWLDLEYRILSYDVVKLIICCIGLKYLYYCYSQLFNLAPATPSKEVPMGSDEVDPLISFSQKYKLTKRQQEIIELIMEGLSNKEIGTKLYITEGTVKTHIYNIFKKTEATNRNQLMSMILMKQPN